jgi:hypothetical protein
MCWRKCLDCNDWPSSKSERRSGVHARSSRSTLPLEQQRPGGSPDHFSALQYWHFWTMAPITMSGWEEYSDEGSYLKPVMHHLARVGRDDPHTLACLWHLDCKRWSRCSGNSAGLAVAVVAALEVCHATCNSWVSADRNVLVLVTAVDSLDCRWATLSFCLTWAMNSLFADKRLSLCSSCSCDRFRRCLIADAVLGLKRCCL